MRLVMGTAYPSAKPAKVFSARAHTLDDAVLIISDTQNIKIRVEALMRSCSASRGNPRVFHFAKKEL